MHKGSTYQPWFGSLGPSKERTLNGMFGLRRCFAIVLCSAAISIQGAQHLDD
jgi:hypothetical protein